jgi:uncharacterized LabA/DUF88 family protein
MTRVYAFIDSQNLNLGVKQGVTDKKTGRNIYNGWNLSFPRFFVYLRDKYHVTRAFLFIGKVKGNEPLYTSLRKAGFTLIYKPTFEITEADGTKTRKGNVDAELVLHCMIEYPNYDQAIIVAGDGDYRCLIQYLLDKGKLARVLIPNRYRFSRQLSIFSKYFDFVSDLEKKLNK